MPRLCAPLLLPLFLVACVSSTRGTTPEPPPCASVPRASGFEPSISPASQPPASQPPALQTASVALRPGRYWFRNGECSALDVRMVRRESEAELMEVAMRVNGGVHSEVGAAIYLVQERVVVGGGFERGALLLEHRCNVEGDQPAVSMGSFGGVPLFEDWRSCEAQECSEGSCIARFALGDCQESVATSARRLSRVTRAEEALRQRTLVRFQRLGRGGRLWRAGSRECVTVQAKREGAALELRYSEEVEGGRADTVSNYRLAPLDLRASLDSFTTTFSPGGGGIGGFGSRRGGAGIPLYFGDGMILLGDTDLFFARAACEAYREAME